ncbi:MAG: GNAT family N-acetyltransferase [Streptomycetales bacterium]
MQAKVRDNPDQERFEVWRGGRLAGFAEYRLRGNLLSLPHTEVEPALEGQGLGSTLVRAALDDARARGLSVLPVCPFVRAFIADHPQYVDLVPPEQRARFDL